MPKVRSITILPTLPEALADLETIANNMYWSWDPEAEALFRRIDGNLWTASGHNPIKLLGGVSQDRLEELAQNEGFLCELQRIVEKLSSYLERPGWYEKVTSTSTRPTIAYFSAEFGVHECIPTYAGGLGILAGDHLKSASDLGIPMVGVGLLYQKGYFRQYLNVDGWQQELYAESDFHNMPLELVCKDDGQPVTISVEYPGKSVSAQIWSARIGRVKLYLLDTNVAANSSTDRIITANLYGGDREMRIRQEIMLGIGGLRALTAMNITPTVCHMNEGHAAFMGLERIRQLRTDKNMTFDEALEATKTGNVFTMHTCVKAGLDEFSAELMDKYFSSYWPGLGITKKRFLALGRVDPADDTEPFKMPILAIRLSSCRNGVSELHGNVSRNMWSFIWPRVPVNEVPIKSITNGVHVKTWLSEELGSLYERYFGPDWADQIPEESFWENLGQVPDEELWRAHQHCKERLIVFARNRLKAQMQRRGTYHSELNWAEEVLDPRALTIGFARRFASYKRGSLLLKDPKRLVKLLNTLDRPVQIVFSGKAHPNDTEGKEIIRQIVHFANQYDVRRRIVFLEDYDINVARFLVRGVDVWLSTPRRPMEASSTSGMKAAINGALNISTLDGWWCEGYSPELGWVVGAGETYADVGYQDMVESQAIYNILENEVVPLFYTRSADNLPRAWIQRMKNSIRQITPQFNTDRMVGEYTQEYYNPAADRCQRTNTDAMAGAKAFAKWKTELRNAWSALAIKHVGIEVKNGQENTTPNPARLRLKVGSQLSVKALIKLGGIDPNDVSVELYHGPMDPWGNIQSGSAVRMVHKETSGHDGEHWFSGSMTCQRTGRHGVTVRILPRHDQMVDPYEPGMILWENYES
ncbi:MAG: alpha-glucan family phosphorylase [Planctomycetota bacterium]|jgi:starch phosphorylase